MTITDELRRYLREAFHGPEGLGGDVSLIDAGIIDSRGMLELIAFIEQRYGFVVGDRDIQPDNFGTLARVAAYVQRMIDRGAPAGQKLRSDEQRA